MRYRLEELCLEVTNSCTMECLHCSSTSIKVGRGVPYHMPISQAIKTVREFAAMGGRVLEISGGEPLVYPGLPELCRHSASLGLEVRLYTSSIACDDCFRIHEITGTRVSELKSMGVPRIIFNLEGSTPKAHESITGVRGSHGMVLQGIRNAKKCGLWTGVHFVPMKPNYQELPEMVRLCDSLGVDELALLRFVPQGRGKTNRSALELERNEFKGLLRAIVDLKGRYPKLNIRAGCPMDFLALYDNRIEPHFCKAGKSTCIISPHGDVLPCPGFKNSMEFSAGNIFIKDLPSIWKDGFESLRKLSPHEIGHCRDCSYLAICGGRCAAQRYIFHGSIEVGPDPGCPMISSTKKHESESFRDASIDPELYNYTEAMSLQ